MKKAKLSQRIRGFFAKIFKKKDTRKQVTGSGNYRNRGKWSREAKALTRQPRTWLIEPLAEWAFDYVRGVMDVYVTYSRSFQLQAANLGRSLIRDVYTPDVLPLLACGRVLNDYEINKLMNEELFQLLCRYGGRDLVFFKYNTKTPPRNVLSDSELIPLGQDIYMTSQRYSMRIRDFLLWYKGGVEVPSAVLTEWSGIPEDHFAIAYHGLVNFFRNMLMNEHREQLATGKLPGKKHALEEPSVIYV